MFSSNYNTRFPSDWFVVQPLCPKVARSFEVDGKNQCWSHRIHTTARQKACRQKLKQGKQVVCGSQESPVFPNNSLQAIPKRWFVLSRALQMECWTWSQRSVHCNFDLESRFFTTSQSMQKNCLSLLAFALGSLNRRTPKILALHTLLGVVS